MVSEIDSELQHDYGKLDKMKVDNFRTIHNISLSIFSKLIGILKVMD